MKKFLITSIILISPLVINAQCADKVVVDLIESSHANQTGFYYKDLNNVLNNFEGHYRYVNGNTIFEVKLQKKEGSTIPSFRYCEDMIIGGYKYVKNGQLITDALNDVNLNHAYGSLHLIRGNIIYTGNVMGCTECTPTEKWMVLSIKDIHSGSFGNLYVRKIIHNGQEALKVRNLIRFTSRVHIEGQPPLPDIQLPESGEEMVLVKL